MKHPKSPSFLRFAFVEVLLAWFDKNARDLPWRRTRDPYAIWISEIMLQQTQVKTVIPYFERWMRVLPDIKALAAASNQKILKLWEGLGYYSRARNAQAAAKIIIDQHDGRFPCAFDDILALPGIGRYTAGAICSIAFNQPAPILDGNVVRVLCRFFGIATNPKENKTCAQLWSLAEQLVRLAAHSKPTPACSQFNQAMMELGALVCLPKSAECHRCPLIQNCLAHNQDRVNQLPNLPSRPVQTTRRFAAFIVKNKDKFLVRQRPAGVVNAQLWEFPNAELPSARCKRLKQTGPFKVLGARPLHQIRHTITRYRIELDVYCAEIEGKAAHGEVFKTLGQMRKLPFSSAHRKILKLLSHTDK